MDTYTQIDRKVNTADQHQDQIGNEIRHHYGQISLNIGIPPNISVYAESNAPGHDHKNQCQHTGQIDLAVEYDRPEPQDPHQIGQIIYANDDGQIHQHQLYFSSA